jgi:hypothetical protein
MLKLWWLYETALRYVFVLARDPLKSQEGAHECLHETAKVSNYLLMEIRSRGHSRDRLYKGIQMESIKSSKQRRRRPFGEDAIDSRQGAALTPMEKFQFSWEQVYLDDLAKIMAYFFFARPFRLQHLACFLLDLFSCVFVVLVILVVFL